MLNCIIPIGQPVIIPSANRTVKLREPATHKIIGIIKDGFFTYKVTRRVFININPHSDNEIAIEVEVKDRA